MLVFAFDPGLNTGMCTADLDTQKVTTVTIDFKHLSSFDLLVDLNNPTIVSIIREKGVLFVVEKVVQTGRLNNDKYTQIRAYDRITQAIQMFMKLHDEEDNIYYTEITPEQRKHLSIKVPTGIHGSHARDAYKQAITGLYLLGVVDVDGIVFEVAD